MSARLPCSALAARNVAQPLTATTVCGVACALVAHGCRVEKLAELGITEQDVEDAVAWARRHD